MYVPAPLIYFIFISGYLFYLWKFKHIWGKYLLRCTNLEEKLAITIAYTFFPICIVYIFYSTSSLIWESPYNPLTNFIGWFGASCILVIIFLFISEFIYKMIILIKTLIAESESIIFSLIVKIVCATIFLFIYYNLMLLFPILTLLEILIVILSGLSICIIYFIGYNKKYIKDALEDAFEDDIEKYL